LEQMPHLVMLAIDRLGVDPFRYGAAVAKGKDWISGNAAHNGNGCPSGNRRRSRH
jgi:hypothetical protein